MSDAIKRVEIDLLSWRTGVSLGLGLLVLTIPLLSVLALPNKAIAQANTHQPALKPEVPETNQSNKTNKVATALEPAILSEINRVRTDPQGYAQWLESQRQYYDGVWLKLPGEKPIRTNKGKKALEEAIALLKEQAPLPPLEISTATANKATAELENFATANNIQYFSYGRKTALGIVMGLVVDDLFPDRRRRQSLLSPNAEDTGVICKPDPRYARVCAIAYSDSPATDLAAAPTPSQAIADTDTVVADVPEIIVPEESSASTEPEEVETTPATSEQALAETQENGDLATLPVPPVPQAPPKPSVEPEQPVTSGTASDLELTEQDTGEPVTEETKAATEAEDTELESEDSAVESESATITDPQEVESSDSTDTQEAESSTVTEAPTETVATKPADDRLLQRVERGSLEQGDRTIAEDGSLYDFYPLAGKSGDSYTIYLESDEFDAFVALVDSNGNTIKENDDISEENSNSRIRVTLPEDGTYNIIVNTYDEKGTGKYILTLSR